MRINKTSAYSTIELAENKVVPKRVQVLRTGTFNHPSYGKFTVTKKTLSEMKDNFDKRVRGIDVAFDYFHESDRDASCWPKRLELSADGTELFAEDVEWTPKAEKKLAERELRYFSPDFTFKWKDPETGKTYENVLFGGGLTNRPFVKEMQPIVADEKNTERGNMTELEKAQKDLADAKAENVKLTEDLKQVNLQLAEGGKAAELKAKIAELQKQLAALEGDNKMMADKVKLAEETAAKAKKEGEFNIMLTEGKAVAAQKEAFMKDDFTEFVKLAQPVNLKAGGSSDSGTTDPNADDEDKIIKLAEKLEKEDPTLDRGASLSLAKKQYKDANKK